MTVCVRRTEQSAHLGILTESQVLLVDFVASDNLINVKNRIGVLEPVYCTAIGKAIAAGLPDAERKELLDGIALVKHTPRTIVSRATLDRRIAEARRLRYAVDDGEFNALLACVAVPLRAPEGLPPMSLGVSMIRPVVLEDDTLVERIISRQGKELIRTHCS